MPKKTASPKGDPRLVSIATDGSSIAQPPNEIKVFDTSRGERAGRGSWKKSKKGTYRRKIARQELRKHPEDKELKQLAERSKKKSRGH